MKSIKQGIALILAALLVIACAGCSGTKPAAGNPGGTTAPQETAQAPEKETASPAKPDYPTKAITMIVPYAAGGGADTFFRSLAQAAQKKLGQTIVIENIDGGSGVTGTTKGKGAANDGYTIIATGATAMVLKPLTGSGDYTINDFEPIIKLSTNSNLLAVRADDDRFQTIGEMIDWIKANPGKFICCTGSTGGLQHLSLLRLFKAAGVEDLVTYVPTSGSAESYTALLGGHVDCMCAAANQIVGHDDMTPIFNFGLGTEDYAADLPNMFSLFGLSEGEYVPLSPLRGIVAPKGTDPAIVAVLYEAFADAMQTPEVMEMLKNESYDLVLGDGAALKADYDAQWQVYAVILGELGML